MIPNIAQSIDDIIKNATPTEKILWQQIRLLTGENASIRQFYFSGYLAAATDLTTYAANKLFLALEINCGFTGNPVPGNYFAAFFDAANNVNLSFENSSLMWNATTAAFNKTGNPLILHNILFSRVNVGNYLCIKMIGFKITY